MKNLHIRIRLAVIIPFIFAGLALLAAIVSYHLGHSASQTGGTPPWFTLLAAAILTLVAFALSLIVILPLLRPAGKLIAQTERLQPPIREATQAETLPRTDDEIARFAHAVNQVTELLSQLEATRLFPEIVGRSRKLLEILSLTRRIADSDASVLIEGESGTGKELIAHALHQHSPRKSNAFVTVNCAAIAPTLLDSELFGHEKGAFTGATNRHIGTFEAAHGGTLFLDEIGDMPLETQAKILRALEQREIRRVGGTTPVPVDVRIVAATNQELETLVAKGRFRKDLFYRINVFTLIMPSLRERPEDIPLLAAYFLGDAEPRLDLSPEAAACLQTYDWPGNVRELRNAIKTAGVLAKSVITPEHLPPAISGMPLTHSHDRAHNAPPHLPTQVANKPANHDAMPEHGLKQHLEDIERDVIVHALTHTAGVQARAAELLGITQRSLWHRVNKLNIDVTAIKKHHAET